MGPRVSFILILLLSITAYADESFYTLNWNKSTFLYFNAIDFCRGKGEYLDKNNPFSLQAMQTNNLSCISFEKRSYKWIDDKRGNYYLLNNLETLEASCLKNLHNLVNVRCINNQTGNIIKKNISKEKLHIISLRAPISTKNSNLVFFLLYLISSLLLVFGILILFKKRWIEQILVKIIYRIKKWGL